MNRCIRLLACLLIPCLLAGCSWRGFWTGVGLAGAAGAGAAAVYYAKGDLEADLDDDLSLVHKASVKALEDRGYSIEEKELDALEGRIVAQRASAVDEESKKVTVRLDRTEQDMTHISIRVGTFGDEALSREILDDIDAQVGKSAEVETKTAAEAEADEAAE